MGNWTPEGHIGQMFKVIGKHVPPPPNFPSPLLWGAEATVRQRLAEGVKDLTITRYQYPFEYPFAPAKVVDFFIEYYGPTNRAYGSLDDGGKLAAKTCGQPTGHPVGTMWTRHEGPVMTARRPTETRPSHGRDARSDRAVRRGYRSGRPAAGSSPAG